MATRCWRSATSRCRRGWAPPRSRPATPPRRPPAIARLRDRLAGRKPEAIVLASSSEPAYAAPAAAYAARSGDPVLFTEAETLSQPTVAELRRDKGVPVYALGPSSAISGEVLKEVEALGTKVTRISGSNPVQSAISFARFEGGKFGWHVADPGHGFVLSRSDAPLEAAAAAPLSASGSWGPLLVTDSADTLPSELRGYFLDVKPGYTTDPTRAFYNHIWIVGDTGQISVEAAGRSQRNRRTGEDRNRGMSEAENPELLGGPQGITVEDIRALAGPATPHFSLQIRNRIKRLIEPFPPGNPVRLEGERQIARLQQLSDDSGEPRHTLGIEH